MHITVSVVSIMLNNILYLGPFICFIKVIGGCSQNLMTGTSGNSALLPAPEVVSSMDDSSFKVGRLSVKERKEKIHRYKKKRNQRNFSKKIKVKCIETIL